MTRPVVAALLTVALSLTLSLPAAPARAGYQPVPYDPLPTSYDQLQMGPATTLAWWQAGTLHNGGTTIRTRYHELASRAGTTVIGSGWSNPGHRSTAVVVRGTTLDRLPVAGYIDGPELSADGHWISWLDELVTPLSATVDRVRYRVVLYDAHTGRIAAQYRETRRLDVDDESRGLLLISVANTGQVVFFRGYDHPFVLTADRDPVRIKGRLPQLRDWDGWPLGMTAFRGRAGADRGVFGTVSPRGRFHEVGSTSTGYGAWSPAGDAFAFELDGVFKDSFWVDHPGAATTIQLGLPAGNDELSVVGWDGPGSVLLWGGADGENSQFLRCDAATGACQRVEAGPVPGSPAAVAWP